MATDYLRAVHAECLKLKRTSALLIACVAPYLVVLLPFLVAMSLGRRLPGGGTWTWLGLYSLTLWTTLVLPVLLSLQAAFLGDLERRNHQWKHLFALPISRGALYAAKVTANVLLLALSTALLSLFVVATGLALRVLQPALSFHEPFPAVRWLSVVGAAFAASGFVLAFHTWVSLRWSSFVIAISLGVVAMVCGLAFANLEGGVWEYFPWRWPALAMGSGQTPSVEPRWVVLGLAGGLVLAVAGGWDVTRRDVT